jgi:hypothetical protein
MSLSTADGPAPGPVAVPGTVLDPRVAMALSVHAAPGVYALLLGSGVSAPSGVKTGWGIVEDLVRRVAAAQAADGAGEQSEAVADPEGWWLKTFGEPLSYSVLLGQVAPSPAARQAQLARYFDPDEDGDKRPTEAHHAIASLVQRGCIRVIITTNFDRLTEQALEEAGVKPQVVGRPESIDKMTPLSHARVTVVKLHGDYADLDQRNTIEELDTYDEALQGLLDRVLDEYGLIVCGWSADWDRALVRSVEGTRSRRYPLFWSSLGSLGANARRLVAAHNACVFQGMTVDETFTDLLKRLDALDSLTTAPITRDIAVVRLKKTLADPVRRIEVSDLVDQSVRAVIAGAAEHPALTGTPYAEAACRYRADSDVLLHLLAHGAFHDDGTHAAVWQRARERLTRIRGSITGGTFDTRLETLRHYPALLATWTIGVALVLSHREEGLYRLLSEPLWTPFFGNSDPQQPVRYLNPLRVLEGNSLGEIIQAPPNGGAWLYPQSKLLRTEARGPLQIIEPSDDIYNEACDRFEFLASLMALDIAGPAGSGMPWAGEFLLDRAWNYSRGLAAQATQEIAPDWPLVQAGAFGGDHERARSVLTELTSWRAQYHRGF